MASKNDGGPAFPRMDRSVPDALPVAGARTDYVHRTVGGMTMRQWYKGHALEGALAGMLSHTLWADLAMGHGEIHKVMADTCGRFADAMLAEDAEHGG